jgi:hypothetical protein
MESGDGSLDYTQDTEKPLKVERYRFLFKKLSKLELEGEFKKGS